MASSSSIEKDSIAATRDSFRDCILACKIRNQTHTNFEQRKVPQAVSDNFAQKWLLCLTYVLHNRFLYLWPKFLKNTFEVVHTQYWPFSRKIHILMKNLLNGYYCYSYFTPNFLNQYFSELLFLVGERKINKIYQRKLKPSDRLWALEITHWKLRLCGKLFCIRQTSQLSQF